MSGEQYGQHEGNWRVAEKDLVTSRCSRDREVSGQDERHGDLPVKRASAVGGEV